MNNGVTETSIQEFLGLSDADMRYIDLKIILKKAVKSYRLKANLTQKELAKLVESSQSRIAKLEGGDSSVSLDMMLSCLLHMGVKNSELASIIYPAHKSQRSPMIGAQNLAQLNGSDLPNSWNPIEKEIARPNMFKTEVPRSYAYIN